ncbi:DUF1778 domain-containing protein [Aquirufa sp. ROCK2-A2]
MKTSTKELSRFDARIPLEQKMLFEKAAAIGGYRNLTDFILMAVQEKAKEIIKENEQILSSVEDAEIFYQALISPKKPSERLKQAFKKHKNLS